MTDTLTTQIDTATSEMDTHYAAEVIREFLVEHLDDPLVQTIVGWEQKGHLGYRLPDQSLWLWESLLAQILHVRTFGTPAMVGEIHWTTNDIPAEFSDAVMTLDVSHSRLPERLTEGIIEAIDVLLGSRGSLSL